MLQGWFGGESDAVAATAGVRSDLAAVEAAAEERRKLHDAFKRQWNEDDIIQVSTEQLSTCPEWSRRLSVAFHQNGSCGRLSFRCLHGVRQEPACGLHPVLLHTTHVITASEL